MEREKISAKRLTLIALFVALLTVSAKITIPMVPVPMTLQTAVVLFFACYLGMADSIAGVAIYIVMGLIGIPVFASGGGFAYAVKPSFGFTLGFLVSCVVCGLIYKKSGNLLDSPQYLVADKKGNFVTIKPVYQSQTEKYILMEVENDKTIDRVLFNRRKPYEYTFDHAVITPYGSASGKTYNSTKEHDKIVEDRVNSYIENFGKKAIKQAEERNLRT